MKMQEISIELSSLAPSVSATKRKSGNLVSSRVSWQMKDIEDDVDTKVFE